MVIQRFQKSFQNVSSWVENEVDPCLYREMTRPRRDTRNVDWEGPALTSQGKSQLKESKRKEREKTKSPCYEFDWGLRLSWSQREAATVTAGAFA